MKIQTVGSNQLLLLSKNLVVKSRRLKTIIYGLLITASLPLSAQSTFYGLASQCGDSGNGLIFSLQPDGAGIKTVFQFPAGHPGIHPGNMVLSGSGKLYGSAEGGKYDKGLIFEFDPVSDAYRVIHDFNGADGQNPNRSGMVFADNGKLYGTTSSGGKFQDGVLFEYDPATEAFRKVAEFDSIHVYQPGGLVKGVDGNLYGIAAGGSNYGWGAAFRFDPNTSVLHRIFEFSKESPGAIQDGLFTPAPDGKLYGANIAGGSAYQGIIYELDPVDSLFTILYQFQGGDLANPYGSLLLAANNKLYGTTQLGSVFEFDPSNGAIEAFSMPQMAGLPYSLLQTTEGTIYSLNSYDTFWATGDGGTILEYDLVHHTAIKRLQLERKDGNLFANSLLQLPDGQLIATAYTGGEFNAGNIFIFDPTTNSISSKIAFGAPEGATPKGGLVKALNGKFYGTTSNGGVNNSGVLFEFDLNSGVYQKKYDFNDTVGGAPTGKLLLASNGKIYGLTTWSHTGFYTPGSIFEFDPASGVLRTVFTFSNDTGSDPRGGLLQAWDGMLYGVTYSGSGNLQYGSMFAFNPETKKFKTVHVFNRADGAGPMGGLLQAFNGNLFGLNSYGGGLDGGVLFEFDPETGVLDKKTDLLVNVADCPTEAPGNLVEDADGNFYGLVANDCSTTFKGVLFKFNPESKELTREVNFTGANGAFPEGDLLIASDGRFYGLASAGGDADAGVAFLYNPQTEAFEKLSDISPTGGCAPFGDLVEVFDSGRLLPDHLSCEVFPNPSSGPVNLQMPRLGGHQVSIRMFNAQGEMVKELFSGTLMSETMRFNLAGFPAGTYFITVATDGKIATRPLVLHGNLH